MNNFIPDFDFLNKEEAITLSLKNFDQLTVFKVKDNKKRILKKLNKINNKIFKACNKGHFKCYFYCYDFDLYWDIKQYLLHLGYKVDFADGLLGFMHFRISWYR